MANNLNNYHWTEADISNYTKEFLSSKLKEMGYEINSLNCESSITQRMGEIGFIYSIKFDLTNSKTKNRIIIEDHDQYSDFDELDDQEDRINMESALLKWKEDAKRTKSGSVQSDKKEKKNPTSENLGKCAITKELKKSENVTNKPLDFKLKLNCSKEEMIKFMFDKECVKLWTNGFSKIDETSIDFMDRVFLKDISEKDGSYVLNMKLKEWQEFSNVNLSFRDIKDGIELHFKQFNSPIENSDAMKKMWLDLVIFPICFKFSKIII